MALVATPEDIARFMSYVDKLPNGCWFWSGARSRGKGNRKWYGSFHVQGRTVRAHRFASEVLGKSDCPPGFHRDHTCRFSLCVNPEHLECVSKGVNQDRKTASHPARDEAKQACVSRLLAQAPPVDVILHPYGGAGHLTIAALQQTSADVVTTVQDLETAQIHAALVPRERVAVYNQDPAEHFWRSHHLTFRPFGLIVDNPRSTLADRPNAPARTMLEKLLPVAHPNCQWLLLTDTAAGSLQQHFGRYGLKEASHDLYAERLEHQLEHRLGVVLWYCGVERCQRSTYHLWRVTHAK